MVGILLDKKYSNSIWCKNFYNGLTERLREKRIPFCEITNTCPKDIDAVFIIASDTEWTKSTIKQLNQGGIAPILLCNQGENIPGCIYNCVCQDINVSIKNLLEKIKSNGKKSIAFYGLNPASIPDNSRAESLLFFKDESINKITVFENNGSLNNCFENFYKVADEYDAIICANDFAAVSLVTKLQAVRPELLEKIFIVSCSYSKISDCYRDKIFSLESNYAQYGKAAVYIYEAFQKHGYLSGLVVKIAWNFNNELPQLPSGNIVISETHNTDSFYDDPELREMLIVDKLLTLSDDTDKKIINSLLNNISYEDMATECFLSVNAIKYRIKNLINDSGAFDKKHMKALLSKYIK